MWIPASGSPTCKHMAVKLLAPSSGILETRKHDVSETGSVSVLK
jgi:hypothetical protein